MEFFHLLLPQALFLSSLDIHEFTFFFFYHRLFVGSTEKLPFYLFFLLHVQPLSSTVTFLITTRNPQLGRGENGSIL